MQDDEDDEPKPTKPAQVNWKYTPDAMNAKLQAELACKDAQIYELTRQNQKLDLFHQVCNQMSEVSSRSQNHRPAFVHGRPVQLQSTELVTQVIAQRRRAMRDEFNQW